MPFYAILRSIPNKLGGIIVLFLAIFVLFILPFINFFATYVRGKNFFWLNKFFFWLFVVCCFLLGWLGGEPVEYPYLGLGEFLTFFFFYYFCFISNIIGELNRLLVFENKNIIYKLLYKPIGYYGYRIIDIYYPIKVFYEVNRFGLLITFSVVSDILKGIAFVIYNFYWYNRYVRLLLYPFVLIEVYS